MIPLATTTISVLRLPADVPEEDDDYRDPYDEQPEREIVASGVRAHIGQPSMSERMAGGTQALDNLRLSCDPFTAGLRATDQILDENTGEVYDVAGLPYHAHGLGLDHITAPVKQIVGVV